MPLKKGVPRAPTAGRKKGTPNKKTLEVQAILEGKNFDPIEAQIYCYEELNKILQTRKETKNLTGAIVCIEAMSDISENLSSYVYPKRKAIEHSGSMQHAVSLADFVALADKESGDD